MSNRTHGLRPTTDSGSATVEPGFKRLKSPLHYAQVQIQPALTATGPVNTEHHHNCPLLLNRKASCLLMDPLTLCRVRGSQGNQPFPLEALTIATSSFLYVKARCKTPRLLLGHLSPQQLRLLQTQKGSGRSLLKVFSGKASPQTQPLFQHNNCEAASLSTTGPREKSHSLK